MLDGCYFSQLDGYDPIDWIESFCRLSVGEKAGQLISLPEWSSEVLYKLFGWKNKYNKRRFRTVYVTIAKKNYKSTLASSLSLYMLMMDNEPGAQIFLAASAADQTNNIFLPCSGMVDSSPVLKKKLKISENNHRIRFGRNSFIKGLSAKDDSSQGKDAHLVVVDELHVWKTPNQISFFNSLRWAGAARAQPVFFMITTRGDDQDTICGQEDDYAIGVSKGEIEDTKYLSIIHAAPQQAKEIELLTNECIILANPVYSTQMQIDTFISEYKEACRKGTNSKAEFLRYRFNRWTAGATAYIDEYAWAKCAKESTPDSLPIAFAGMDVASREDIASYAICYEQEGRINFITRHFCPEAKVESIRANATIKARYDEWADTGSLIVTPGIVIDQEIIKERFKEDAALFQLVSFYFDRWNADQIALWVERTLGISVVQFGQGYKSFSTPTKNFRADILSGAIAHDNNPVMNWMIKNTLVTEDVQENVKPVKKWGKLRYKIDGTVAAIMAYAAYSQYSNEQAQFYEVNPEVPILDIEL